MLTIEEFYTAKKMLEAAQTPAHMHTFTIPLNSGICTSECPAPAKWPSKKAKKEEVTPMASYASANVVTADTIERDQREAVRSALRTAKYAKLSELEKQFGLTDDASPRTPAEFIERITSGKYTVDEKNKDEWTYAPANYIRWRDPSVVEDRAGYKAAAAKLDEAYQDAKLKAVLLPVADLLKLVEDFKAFEA